MDVLVSVSRTRSRTLSRQIEDQFREQIRQGALRPGARVPSTRDLAAELGVSRPIVVTAYAQLAAEGYLTLRQGARPCVADGVRAALEAMDPGTRAEVEPLYDFRPGVPDLAAFPRSAWLRSLRDALRTMPDAALGYTDACGSEVLRRALSEYLARVRGVVSSPSRVVITSGWAQGRSLLCRALAATGARKIAVEDPCWIDAWASIGRAGLEPVAIPVDDQGLRVDLLAQSDADVVIVTPAHQYPSGTALSGERRAALLEWLRRRDAIAIEDDYDAEFRYDRAPVGALQSLDPARIVYAGTASKTLAPALRLGWLVVPAGILTRVQREKEQADFGGPRIEQHAFADFLSRGELDRHLRRMRARYRGRRDVLVDAMRRHLPEAELCGIAAGLHAAVRLPPHFDEIAIRDAALTRGVAFTTMQSYQLGGRSGPPTLILGYARASEPTIREGVRELAVAVRSTFFAATLAASAR